MEGISEARLLSLFGCKGFHRLQIEVIVEMQVIQILSMYKKVQHIVALADYLEAGFYPIKLSQLEELRFGKGFEQGSLALRFGGSMMKLVKDPDFQKLLIRYSNFNRVSLWASFFEPRRYKRYVITSTSRSRSLVEGIRSPIEINRTHSFLII